MTRMTDGRQRREMAEQHSQDPADAAREVSPEGERQPAAPGVSSPELEHLQQTIDDARDAAKAALSDQPDV
jgi:hypothetical protein